MSFVNETRYAALPVPLLDLEGRDVVVTIVKATFVVTDRGELRPAEDPSPVRTSDVAREPDDPRSSLLFPSDIGLEKPGTDVVVVGDAVAPRPVKVMDVVVQVKKHLAPLRVHGPRVYYDGVLDVAVGPAAPFERVPIVYENAYGGASEDLSVVELANPAGVGAACRASDLIGKRAPQIEHPERPHTTASDRHPPMGYGAIPPHWSPRREHVGTCGSHWQKTRMPMLPADHDPRFACVAHPSLRFEEMLAPGDPVRVLGMSLAPLALELPRLAARVHARFDGGEREERPVPIDTVIVLPAERRLEIAGRVAFAAGRARRVLRALEVRANA
ncbi:DUF2169 family type VI secretion system accessory protein [Polyangium jinanense]|uniref:DUF2169 domain-containing protein n=1 Tax=Polyangium jinanense TaxID=2829994 RepID=A0A9X3XCD4_9BACT|nr:DUF2169 domain-containing protein [Polyangium jinanense]MDC3961373.1 DUF2169 domain-containing protein [Polyangium jinanense]MDC3987752.1 DUF2169 domain-containing protein [Polyangium jinanense]